MTPAAAHPWWIALAGALLAALLLGLEWRRQRYRRRSHRVLRLLATLAAVAALVLLALRPARWVSADPRAAVLYTAGATAQETGPGEATLRFALAASTGKRPGPPDAVVVPDAGYLARRFPEVARLIVLGHGLDRWQLDALAARIKAGPAPAPSPGLERVTWTRHLWLGERFEAQGRWTAARPEDSLELYGPGGVEATVAWPSPMVDESAATAPVPLAAPKPFQFSSRPRTAGRFLYRLNDTAPRSPADPTEGGRSATTVAQGVPAEPAPLLDVVVERPAPVRLLWLESAPRFETRHFKHWFTEQAGGALALRTQISRDRYRFETVPAGDSDSLAAAPARLNREALAAFDLAVLDPGTLRALSGGEMDALRAAVAEDGLGILLLPYGEDNAPAQRLRRLGLDFPVRRAGPLAELDVRLDLSPTADARALDAEPPPVLTIPAREIALNGSGAAIEPLVRDTAGRVLAARRPLGAGAVGVDLALDSFRWVLAGHPEEHAALWSRLVSALARTGGAHRWQLPPEPALLDQPWTLMLRTDAEAPSATVTGPNGAQVPLALAQDSSEPTRWSTRFWPRTEGWHLLSAGSAREEADSAQRAALAESWFYAQPAEPWQSWLEARRREATTERAAQDAAAAGTGRQVTTGLARQRRELPRGAFYALLLVSLVGLWIDERLHPPTR